MSRLSVDDLASSVDDLKADFSQLKLSFTEMEKSFEKIQFTFSEVIKKMAPVMTVDAATVVDATLENAGAMEENGLDTAEMATQVEAFTGVDGLLIKSENISHSTIKTIDLDGPEEVIEDGDDLYAVAVPKNSFKKQKVGNKNFQYEEYYSKEKLKQWLRVMRIKCSEENCQMTLTCNKDYYLHMKQVHGINYYRCYAPGCKQSFEQMDKLKEHLDTDHSDELGWMCEKCCSTFSEHNVLHMHTLFHHQEGIFACKRCQFTSTVRVKVMRHSGFCTGQLDHQLHLQVPLLQPPMSPYKRSYPFTPPPQSAPPPPPPPPRPLATNSFWASARPPTASPCDYPPHSPHSSQSPQSQYGYSSSYYSGVGQSPPNHQHHQPPPKLPTRRPSGFYGDSFSTGDPYAGGSPFSEDTY